MLNDQANIMKDFEQEIWLYIDDSLSESRKKYWEEKMQTLPLLREYYEEALATLNTYNSIQEPHLDDSVYNRAIKEAVYSNKFNFRFWEKLFSPENKPELFRVAFASLLVIFITVFLIFLNQPGNQPGVDRSILEWDGGTLNKKITNVENSIYLLQNEKSVDKMIYNYTRDGWNLARTTIEYQIKQIKKEIKDNTL